MQQDFATYADEIEKGLQADSAPKIVDFSAFALQKELIPPIRFVVNGLLAPGLSLLCGSPKVGKSWFSLSLCLSVANGDRFLGFTVNKSECLYLALEDSKRRLKSRLDKLLNGREAPENFHLAIKAATLEDGLLDMLKEFLDRYPNTKLIVIDTLQKIRGITTGSNVYGSDYRDVGKLKEFADRYGVAILVIHHLRKMADDSDPFNRISGSNGVLGAADAAFVIEKQKRGEDKAIMAVTGRDIDGDELVLYFDRETCQWKNQGRREDIEEKEARESYEEDPLVYTINALLEQSETWTGTASQLMDEGKRLLHMPLADNPRQLSSNIKRVETLLFQNDKIIISRSRNGSGGSKYHFSHSVPVQEESMEQYDLF